MATIERYYDDVSEGDELDALIRNPTEISLFRYSAVTWNAHRIHYDKSYASEVEGHPGILVQAHLHGAYLQQLVMNWMGPHGILRKLKWQNRNRAIAGEKLTCYGRVVEKYEEDGHFFVRCEIREENAEGLICAPGEAVVELPRRL